MAELFLSFWIGSTWFSVDIYHWDNHKKYYEPETEIILTYTWEF